MAGNGGILCTCAVGVDLRGKGFSASRGIELAEADIAPQPEAEELGGNRLVQYLRHGGTAVPRADWQFTSDYKLASGDGGVDRTWYLEIYPDVARSGLDPTEHYLRSGWREHRDPRPDFSTSGYLKANPHVESNPLVHYLRHSGTAVPRAERQFTSDYKLASGEGGVDRTWYLQTYPDVPEAGIPPY